MKKIGETIPPHQELLPVLISPIAIMIIFKPNLNSHFTKPPNLIILGSLMLIKILVAFFLSSSLDGGCILVSYQKFSLSNFNSFKNHFKTNDYGSKFSPILHFATKFKIPWILKWQYVIIDDKVERHWYVKWWDKYPQVNSIVNNAKELAQTPKAQTLLPNTPPQLLTPSAFLPLVIPQRRHC
jgi:hypothetical protein